MARRCALTGKGILTGNNVSHAKNRTRRRFLPNLQNVSFHSDALSKNFKLRVCTKAIRTIEHNGGFDRFLLTTSNRKLTEEAVALKKQILKASPDFAFEKKPRREFVPARKLAAERKAAA